MQTLILPNSLLAAEAVSKILPAQQFVLWDNGVGEKYLPHTHTELLHFTKKQGTGMNPTF